MSEILKAATLTSASSVNAITQLADARAATDALNGEGIGSEGDFLAAVVPDGHTVALVDIERLNNSGAPGVRRGTARFSEIDPLVAYVTLHHDPEATTIWINHDAEQLGTGSHPVATIEAVLDDHDHGGGAWGDHRAVLPLITTPEWRHWIGGDGNWHGQAEFSEHLRQGLVEIINPDHATILEVAESLTLHNSDDLVSIQRANGEVHIERSVDQTARRAPSGDGSTDIPETFTLRIAPFAGADAVELVARLKFRSTGGGVALGYTLQRPAEALRVAVERVFDVIKQGVPGPVQPRVYRGQPIPTDARKRPVPKVGLSR